jgi:hypothetical protein
VRIVEGLLANACDRLPTGDGGEGSSCPWRSSDHAVKRFGEPYEVSSLGFNERSTKNRDLIIGGDV